MAKVTLSSRDKCPPALTDYMNYRYLHDYPYILYSSSFRVANISHDPPQPIPHHRHNILMICFR